MVDHGRVIALGTPRELIASLGADQVVELTIEGDASGLMARCAAIAGVLDVKQEGDTLALKVARLHETLPLILERLREAGAVVAELRTHAPTLEDVFVALTGRRLRDE